MLGILGFFFIPGSLIVFFFSRCWNLKVLYRVLLFNNCMSCSKCVFFSATFWKIDMLRPLISFNFKRWMAQVASNVWYFIPQALGYNCHSGEEQPGLLSLEEPWPMVQKPCRDFLKKKWHVPQLDKESMRYRCRDFWGNQWIDDGFDWLKVCFAILLAGALVQRLFWGAKT